MEDKVTEMNSMLDTVRIAFVLCNWRVLTVWGEHLLIFGCVVMWFHCTFLRKSRVGV